MKTSNLNAMTEQARINYANLSQGDALGLLRRLEQILAGGVTQEEAAWAAAQWNALNEKANQGEQR